MYTIYLENLTKETKTAVRAASEKTLATLPTAVAIPEGAILSEDRKWRRWVLREGDREVWFTNRPSEISIIWSIALRTIDGGTAVIATPQVTGYYSMTGWDEWLMAMLGLVPREVGRLEETIVPLLPSSCEDERPSYPACDCGQAYSKGVYALRSEAIAWRRAEAARLLASCEE